MMKKSLLLTILLFSAVFIGTAWGQSLLTVCDDVNDSNDKVPFLTTFNDWSSGVTSEFVIPAELLTPMGIGSTITSLKFYMDDDDDCHGSVDDNLDATWIVYLCEIESCTLDKIESPEDRVIVYRGEVDASDIEMTIEFTENYYLYNGGHLLIGTCIEEEGSGCPPVCFLGEEHDEAAYYNIPYYGGGNVNFIPKTTFTYVSPSVSCITPTNVACSDITKSSATISWTSESSNFNIKYKKTADPDVTGNWETTTSTTTSCLLEDLDSETEYEVQVQAVCSATSQSDWTSSVTFTTMEAHPIPTNLNVTSITNSSALISWTGYDESYTLAYRNSPYFIKEGFEGGTLPTGWSCTGSNDWKVGYGDDSGITQPHSGNYNAKRNNGGSYDYLITPEMDLSYITEAYLSCYYINREEWDEFDEEYKNDFFGIYYRINGGSWIELFYTEDAHNEWVNFTLATLPNLADHYQIGFRYCGNFGCGVALDDVVIGITNLGPSWNTDNNVINEYLDLSGLGSGTYYEVKVKNNERVDYSDTYVFNTLPKVYTTNSDWDDMTVTSIDNIRISADVTILDGTVAIANHITIDGGSLTIEDGGQLIASNSVAATVKKTIANAGAKDESEHWYTIASPVNDGTNNYIGINNTNTVNLTADSYDMFAYDEKAGMWLNQKEGSGASGFDKMYKGQGYLYRNSGNELSFVGNTNSGEVTYTLKKENTGDLAGFNLIGNPYSHNITLNHLTYSGGSDLTGCYVLSDAGAWGSELAADATISPYQGFLVQADVDDKVATFHETAQRGAKSNGDNIKFMVANSQYEDVAYALFDKGFGLSKINHRNADIPMLYINQEDADYAIATMSDDTKSFNLNFKAMTTGKYTLSYKADGNFSYLHVIDRLTGEDVDMLLEGEYSFIASPIDNENRFIVRLEYSAGSEISESSIFAYQSGNDIIVNGEGELQVFDVMGRMIATHRINGVETINLQSHGVYIFKLNEKTQKIVVK
jgi:hypothetical protein